MWSICKPLPWQCHQCHKQTSALSKAKREPLSKALTPSCANTLVGYLPTERWEDEQYLWAAEDLPIWLHSLNQASPFHFSIHVQAVTALQKWFKEERPEVQGILQEGRAKGQGELSLGACWPIEL